MGGGSITSEELAEDLAAWCVVEYSEEETREYCALGDIWAILQEGARAKPVCRKDASYNQKTRFEHFQGEDSTNIASSDGKGLPAYTVENNPGLDHSKAHALLMGENPKQKVLLETLQDSLLTYCPTFPEKPGNPFLAGVINGDELLVTLENYMPQTLAPSKVRSEDVASRPTEGEKEIQESWALQSLDQLKGEDANCSKAGAAAVQQSPRVGAVHEVPTFDLQAQRPTDSVAVNNSPHNPVVTDASKSLTACQTSAIKEFRNEKLAASKLLKRDDVPGSTWQKSRGMSGKLGQDNLGLHTERNIGPPYPNTSTHGPGDSRGHKKEFSDRGFFQMYFP